MISGRRRRGEKHAPSTWSGDTNDDSRFLAVAPFSDDARYNENLSCVMRITIESICRSDCSAAVYFLWLQLPCESFRSTEHAAHKIKAKRPRNVSLEAANRMAMAARSHFLSSVKSISRARLTTRPSTQRCNAAPRTTSSKCVHFGPNNFYCTDSRLFLFSLNAEFSSKRDKLALAVGCEPVLYFAVHFTHLCKFRPFHFVRYSFFSAVKSQKKNQVWRQTRDFLISFRIIFRTHKLKPYIQLGRCQCHGIFAQTENRPCSARAENHPNSALTVHKILLLWISESRVFFPLLISQSYHFLSARRATSTVIRHFINTV